MRCHRNEERCVRDTLPVKRVSTSEGKNKIIKTWQFVIEVVTDMLPSATKRSPSRPPAPCRRSIHNPLPTWALLPHRFFVFFTELSLKVSVFSQES